MALIEVYDSKHTFAERSTGSWGDAWPEIFGSIWNIFGGPELPRGSGRVPVPEVISEVPQTWEEYEQQYPEYFEPILETRPGRTPDPYPQDVSDAEKPEDDEVAHTWSHWGRELIGDWLNPEPTVYNPPDAFAPGTVTAPPGGGGGGAMGDCDGAVWSGAAPPKGYKVVNHCGVGVLRKIRRRRRPRIATNSDLADISAIVGIVGKGQLATALISRRGR